MSALEHLLKCLSHNIWVHIYSSPSFLVETCMSVLMCIVHCLLIIEINTAMRKINVPPLKLKSRLSIEEVNSQRSVSKGVVRRHPELGVDVVFKDDDNSLKSEWDTTTKINKLLNTTISEYIRRDIQKRVKEKLAEGDGEEGENAAVGMEKVYDSIMQEPEIQRRLACKEFQKVDRNEELILL